MTERIQLTKDDITIHELGESFNHTFAFLEIYANGSHHLTDIRQLKQQLLEDTEKASFRDYLVEQYWYKEIRDNGTNWYDELKKNSEKWNKFSSQCIINITDNVTTIEPIINKELEQENQQYKTVIDEIKKRIKFLQEHESDTINSWMKYPLSELKAILSKLGDKK